MSQPLAFVFPGQGSQSVGMLGGVAEQFSGIRDTFSEASDALDVDLWTLCQQGPETELNRTDLTQPALLTAGAALWNVWQEKGGAAPAMMSGHSLGEYTALVCAGAISLADGVRLVNKRGKYMQSAVPPGEGGMAAIIGLDDEAIIKACADAAQGDVVSAVNFNSPGQVVIAGQSAAVDRAIALCSEAGAKRALPLAVSVPSHCDLMQPAAEKLSADLDAIEVVVPSIPVVQNVSAAVAESADQIKTNLLEQLYRPVLWVDCVNTMVNGGVEILYECGPGKVLSGLNKRIHRSLNVSSLGEGETLADALSA